MPEQADVMDIVKLPLLFKKVAGRLGLKTTIILCLQNVEEAK